MNNGVVYVPEVVCSSNGPWFIAFRIPSKANKGKGELHYLPVEPRKSTFFGFVKRSWTPQDCPTSYGEPGVALYQFQNPKSGERVMQLDVLRVWEKLHIDIPHYLTSINVGTQVPQATYKMALCGMRNAHGCCGECGRKYDARSVSQTTKGVCGECAAKLFAAAN